MYTWADFAELAFRSRDTCGGLGTGWREKAWSGWGGGRGGLGLSGCRAGSRQDREVRFWGLKDRGRRLGRNEILARFSAFPFEAFPRHRPNISLPHSIPL